VKPVLLRPIFSPPRIIRVSLAARENDLRRSHADHDGRLRQWY
jgi:hypothetical protein